MQRIVVLTGAGISQESGLQTFRGPDGLWNHERIEDICTPQGFARDPLRVDRFYNGLRAQLPTVHPNAAHKALATLEQAGRNGKWPGHLTIITQNIDDLHERAGSRNVIHMHGELLRLRCTHCHATPVWKTDCYPHTPCPDCGAAGLRPDIVWFGEMPYHMEAIARQLEACDLFVAIGTSGVVYPAAGFVDSVADHADTMLFNLEAPAGRSAFDQTILGPATSTVPAWTRDLLEA
ncbi:NAD-dependent protein deacylase [Komagataeibacter nataicola]|uniref:NAD-dependent protein deacylase n=1 Tax=Komagataeibacter nataicola TaxID=265960 RepID=A0A9N7CPE5_9PROT|nr:NAD-dependent deacylase [Komagataeibacter nataicola]AQU88294.1 NAD-dependent protein deacylase [Komagataeibacter nataicola]PYD67648.1 NAD-dependent protein deacylase [Komagataeibacter nataicola]WEQ54599.1 NAD-dependent deacylase [Komagataeibacter nataicola]WNM08976.1 NAD-dependent deacylase [Komagataeibacter nataicola]GBR13759.1 NAD-dependent deacetylase [Komagataeibacter nataicola NRIC 0616]